MVFNYIHQVTEYGCGVCAVMNAVNYGMFKHGYGLKHQFDYKHSEMLEKVLGTDEDFGTEEWPMVEFLRNYFHVTIRKSFSKKKLDNWLSRGHQVIILYPYSGKDELHYSNIFQKAKSQVGGRHYKCANVWWKQPNGKLWRMYKTLPEGVLAAMYKPESLIMYIRWRSD